MRNPPVFQPLHFAKKLKEAGEVKRNYKNHKHFKASNLFQEIKVEINLNAISKRIWQHCGTMRLKPPLAWERGQLLKAVISTSKQKI